MNMHRYIFRDSDRTTIPPFTGGPFYGLVRVTPGVKTRTFLLAGWFPQITCRQHKDIYNRLLSSVFQVHLITG